MELRHTILEELQTNPVLEELPTKEISVEANVNSDNPQEMPSDEKEMDFQANYEVLQRLTEDWQDYYSQEGSQQRYTNEDASRRQHFIDSIVSETSFQEFLLGQLKMVECSDEERKALEFMIGSLDDSGLLTMDTSAIADLSKLPIETIERALKILQAFDPPGIGCRSVQESLLVQLEVAGKKDSIARTIVQDHYSFLLRRRIPELAKVLRISIDEVYEAIEDISALDPAPGGRYKPDSNSAIVPDITIHKADDKWTVTLNNDYIPRLQINPVYKRFLLKKSLSESEKDYIRTQMKSGRFLIGSIDQRQKTIEKIANVVLELQKDFFENGISQLHPLTMSYVAKVIGIHETTVSRAVANKFVKTPHGVLEFKFFFTTGLQSDSGEETGVSNTSIKDKIQQLINSEDPTHPLSDQEIANILSKSNISIARRTVAKYREELGIVSTNLRRQYN